MRYLAGVFTAVACAAVCCTAGLHSRGEEPADTKPAAIRDKAAMRKKLLEARQKRRVESGGIVYSEPEGKVFEVVNRQDLLPAEHIKAAADAVMAGTQLPIRVVAEVSAAAGAVLEVVATDSDSTILCKPEDGWAMLNVKRLMSDNPSGALLEGRLRKEMWRSVGAALGMGVSVYQPCVMRNIRTLQDLDNCRIDRAGPASLNVFTESAQFFGIVSIKRNSYRAACEEGWAPPPTNDVQKAIWEKVQADKERGPTNPITIQPPKAK